MATPLRRASLFCLLLVLALMARATWLAVAKADEYAGSPANARTTIDRYSQPLGNILVGGQPVTGSTATDGTLAHKRSYTDGPLYAPVTGYTSQAYGSNQLENLYADLLDGSDPRLAGPVDRLTDQLTRTRPAGGDVVTTIDPAVQKAAWDALGGKQGAAVAIDPATGRILALVSTPSYDPSGITGRDGAAGREWQRLSADQGKAMVNGALRTTLAPGSTFKLVVAAAALENGLYRDVDTPTDSPNPYTLPNTRTVLTNENASAPCLNATLRTALQYSCNNVFAKAAADLGEGKLTDQAKKLFSVTATPLQMAMVSAAIANDGVLMKPFEVDRLTDHSGRTVQQFDPERQSQAMSARTAEQLRSAMATVVEQGTGRAARVPGLTVGGKTGTAQNGVDNSGIPYAWFTSYAEDGKGKKIATAAVVLNGSKDRDEITGGGLAGPVTKAMTQSYLR
ncbi:penicillin-binding transpeptidase domain-containing protein [Kitasatospora albolonga]|uniref:penicillin-binding transpeptidase domain-containing protein n=1 Tax=Kitasatospora albolonga TaxID=68173 RepID=UPI0031ED1B10